MTNHYLKCAPSELVHHGIKGMHWGIRKERKPTGRVRARSLSDTELKDAIARWELEKKYSELHNEVNVSSGKKLVNSTVNKSVANVADKQLTALLTFIATIAAGYVAKKVSLPG